MTILEQLADHARVRVAAAKEKAGLDTLQAQCRSLGRTLGHGQGRERFQKALSKPGLSFLCELKKASPSKGLIDPEFPYLDIAADLLVPSCVDTGSIRRKLPINMTRKNPNMITRKGDLLFLCKSCHISLHLLIRLYYFFIPPLSISGLKEVLMY